MINYLTFSEDEYDSYEVAILSNELHLQSIEKHYINPFGINPKDVIAIQLYVPPKAKKVSVKDAKQFCEEVLYKSLEKLNVKYVVVTDATYFKILSKQSKAEPSIGYVLDSEDMIHYVSEDKTINTKILYAPNYRQAYFNPEHTIPNIHLTMKALTSHREGNYVVLGSDLLKNVYYPETYEEIKSSLDFLIGLDCPISYDIEAFSLKHIDSGIGTISFSWGEFEEGNAIAFPVDYVPLDIPENGMYGKQIRNEPLRELLRYFFETNNKTNNNRIVAHNISFDNYVLIYQLYMKDMLDTEGLLKGMEVLFNNWDCTNIIAYLATNSTAEVLTSLKERARDVAGSWAMDSEDIKDIRRIPLETLLPYNANDTITTLRVLEKDGKTMIEDDQLEVYETIFKPAVLDVVQMQLSGMPIDIKEVQKTRKILETELNRVNDIIHDSIHVKQYVTKKRNEWIVHKNSTLKTKSVGMIEATDKVNFNPNSNNQLQELLFDELNLPVLEYTKNKNPSTGGDVIKDLVNHTTDIEISNLLTALADYKAVDKILSTFVPALESSYEAPDGWHYLFGFFRLGGTVSGRMSSNSPNLQNIPAKGNLAKLIKNCFKAPPGWVFVGLDFDSLEDKISALQTKDPNKLKVYTDGYDGHSFRAFYYFSDQMPDIDPTSVESINSIEIKYPHLRQESKTPTFLLTYQGTHIGMSKKCGFSLEKALNIENNYKELYKVSIKYVQDKITQATKDGYVTCAFGLRVRTPLLKQVLFTADNVPYEAQAEARTAGNAIGQSWCLLNNRAASQFMGLVRASEYRLDIKPSAHIHDAQYYLIKDDITILKYVNDNLVDAVFWQDHPEIYHEEVKLGGKLSVFYPNWNHEITLPNYVDSQQLLDTISTHINKNSEEDK